MAATPDSLAQSFDAQFGDVASSLGDATRRGIYIATRESADAVTVAQVADLFNLHPNVARHHLDRLVDDGYVRVAAERRSAKSGPGSGRPAKCYEATSKEVAVQYPPRRYDLLSELLVRVVERLAPEDAPAVAEQIGREFGTELAAEVGLPSDDGFDDAVQAVASVMMGVGFGTTADSELGVLVTSYCPFGQTAANHPEVVCKLDQGIVQGLMEAAHQRSTAHVTPHDLPGDDCVTSL